MSRSVLKLLENNKRWAQQQRMQDPSFYRKLSRVHAPEFLWIGCSDARVPANQITGTAPGSIFVHRNIANLVIHTDINLLSCLSFAVEVLRVKHIIVCGHYGCGGVAAALSSKTFGLIDNWLRHIRDTHRAHLPRFRKLRTARAKADLLVELNVREQVFNLSNTTVVRNAWNNRKFPYVHGWVYSVHDGLIRNLGVTVHNQRTVASVFGPAR